jgi:hypothetical protein
MNAETDKFNPVKFIWGQRNIEFNAWQVAHFRFWVMIEDYLMELQC